MWSSSEMPDERLLRICDAAKLLGVDRRTLQRLTKRGEGPPVMTWGKGSRRIPLGALRQWLAVASLRYAASSGRLALPDQLAADRLQTIVE